MSETLARVQSLASRGEIRISAHGYDELAADDIFVSDVIAGVAAATVVEDYPKFARGPCVLVLQEDADGHPIHVVWGIPKDNAGPAVVVTAYRPDPARWSSNFLTRKRP
jgi:Domain of unknown function (DUF4258)